MTPATQRFLESLLGAVFWFGILAFIWKMFLGKKSMLRKASSLTERGVELQEEGIRVQIETNRLMEKLIEAMKSKNS